MVLHAFAVASVKSSCESILESFLYYFDEHQNVDEQTSTEEFEISVNGISLSHADSVITVTNHGFILEG